MNFDLLIDLHKGGHRQGPGDDAQTLMAMSLAGLSDVHPPLAIADIGCGTGAASLTLAEHLSATITAVDLFPEFLQILEQRAQSRPLKGQIKTLAGSMDQLPFEENSLDVIWSEGAIYNIGFEKGISYFKQFLKPGGILALSEITWLTQQRPAELNDHWVQEYPEIATAAEKIQILEDQGFIIKGYFPLPETCWLDNYYRPLQNRFDDFLRRNSEADAQAIIDAEQAEIALYERYRSFYSYGFYIAQKA